MAEPLTSSVRQFYAAMSPIALFWLPDDDIGPLQAAAFGIPRGPPPRMRTMGRFAALLRIRFCLYLSARRGPRAC